MKPKRLLRIFSISLGAYLFFSYVLLPLRIEGRSMEPTYADGGFNFCWRLQYLYSKPKPGDVVAIRFAGTRVVLLKRVVALAGDTVAFKNGVLLVNNRKINEPYVRYNSNWNLPPRKVAPGRVYVVGDNRGVAMERHYFGQVSTRRLLGTVGFGAML